MRTSAGAGARFYIGSASPKAVKEKLALSTGMTLFLRKPLVGKLLGMKLGKKTCRGLERRNFDIVKRRHRTPECGSFSVFDFYLIAPEFAKAKKKKEARLG